MKAKDFSSISHKGAGCLLYILESKKFLLLKRSDFVSMPNTWCVPGGKVEQEEPANFAAVRETYEETGYKLDLSTIHLIYTNETYAPRFKFYTFVHIVDKPFKPKLNWESIDYMWTTIDDLPNPLHWGLTQLFNSDRAAKRLLSLIDQNNR